MILFTVFFYSQNRRFYWANVEIQHAPLRYILKIIGCVIKVIIWAEHTVSPFLNLKTRRQNLKTYFFSRFYPVKLGISY